MRVPTLQGIIRRRILVNFRAEPDVVQRLIPNGFRPKLHKDKAIVGVCLIRLEHIRPKFVPSFLGINSENAAHRIAVEWDVDGGSCEGVFIPRRDTDSTINAFVGGTLFPGEHNKADFVVVEDDIGIDFSMSSKDKMIKVVLKGMFANKLPTDSIFSALASHQRSSRKVLWATP